MSQPIATINNRLLESLAQIILSLSEEEYQILVEKILHSRLAAGQEQQNIKALKQDIAVGIEQLQKGQYTEYDENSLPTLITLIKAQ
ncbi:MAG: hypothetical protein DSM107014_09395 [Gomphosphaeria aponina SAG 52.96 = DSM 107014]|uniref:Uncharacterized protein n=1 Tax=Gomphosphaeria aponina SAG 52.96 = DSM 107014 TaxID=1521640 RepID=A0A941GQP6_9CHRO|nr:hypothetical protein [Gomphosphaeria aponina SAG 52.96 = DSM 107014]